MFKHVIATALTLAAFSASAQVYGEIGYTSVTVKDNDQGFTFKSSPTAVRGILGYEINPNFAIEGLAAFGMKSDKIKENGSTLPGAKFEIDNVFGIYAKPKVKFTPELEGFVRAGFAQTKATYSEPGYSESDSESSFSYGLGMNYALNKTTSLNVDYMSYYKKDGVTATGFTFGVGYKF
jgi:opacity protein-like surface antigen